MGRSIKRDKADTVFSQYIRTRDGECRRCHSPVEFNAKGLPVTHQASHFMGRRKENTRFDEDNVDTLCGGCHMYFTEHPMVHLNWQIEMKGQKKVDEIILRSGMRKRKDREMDFIYWSARLKQLNQGFGG